VLARNAPGRPEIQDYDLSPVPADIPSVPVRIAQGELRSTFSIEAKYSEPEEDRGHCDSSSASH
jgi:hypothetical protein